jgi:hypothetical protein
MARIRPDVRRLGTSSLWVLLLATVPIPGCGHGTGIGRSSNLQVQALTPSGRTRRWRITAQIMDPNDDVVGGRASVTIYRVNENQATSVLLPPELSMTIFERDFRGDRFTAILVLNNGPGGESSMIFNVWDAAGNIDFADGSLILTIPAAPRPDPPPAPKSSGARSSTADARSLAASSRTAAAGRLPPRLTTRPGLARLGHIRKLRPCWMAAALFPRTDGGTRIGG